MLDCKCADEEDGLQQYYAADSRPAPAAAATLSGAGATPPAASASGTAKHPVLENARLSTNHTYLNALEATDSVLSRQ